MERQASRQVSRGKGPDRSTPLLFMVGVALAACGTGPDCSGVPVAEEFPQETATVERRTGADLSRVLVRLEPTMACPTSGRRCCLARKGIVPCGDGTDDLCGYAGLFSRTCMLIRLPDECLDALSHELQHAADFLLGKPA